MRARRLALSSAVLLGALVCCAGLRQDELLCEEATAHLVQCCPHFDNSSICYYSSGCGVTDYPAFSIATSQCIDAMSCADLVSSNVCQRAQQAREVAQYESGVGDGEFLQVCP